MIKLKIFLIFIISSNIVINCESKGTSENTTESWSCVSTEYDLSMNLSADIMPEVFYNLSCNIIGCHPANPINKTKDDAILFNIIKNGSDNQKMPPQMTNDVFTDDDICHMVAYIKSQ
ncbi:MAG: cytochrome c [Spirochaetia bacterium]|nr:cytochrome c [Spirochaetia bacterium]